jgi:hypothetical protein
MSKGQQLVCNGAVCVCNKGSAPSKLKVTSHNKDEVQDKLIATNQDKTFKPFGTCALKRNKPCSPSLTDWEGYYEEVGIVEEENKPLLEKSTIKCTVGGTVSIKDTLQIEIPGTPTAGNMEEIRSAFMGFAPVMVAPR